MLTKRIVPCLDIKEGRTVKGTNFVGLRDAGDAIELAEAYVEQGADELVFLDITATVEGRSTLVDLVKKVARALNIPFTVGGGISSVADVSRLLHAGADKVSVNSAAVSNPGLIDELAKAVGSQCVVVAIDTRYFRDTDKHVVHSHGGRTTTQLETFSWAKEVESRGAGEILLTSIDVDGTKNGFDLPITAKVSSGLGIPVIASGGAGTMSDFYDVFTQGKADAALAASIFHFREIGIPGLKEYLQMKGIPMRHSS